MRHSTTAHTACRRRLACRRNDRFGPSTLRTGQVFTVQRRPLHAFHMIEQRISFGQEEMGQLIRGNLSQLDLSDLWNIARAMRIILEFTWHTM
jgi:hypothetical protein